MSETYKRNGGQALEDHADEASKLFQSIKQLQGSNAVVSLLPEFLVRCELAGMDPHGRISEVSNQILEMAPPQAFDSDRKYFVSKLDGIFRAELIRLRHSPRSESSDLVYFRLDRDDRGHVFELCGEMRKIVVASQAFDQPHRNRLLKRISAIETEVGKEQGMLDVILGGMSDVGEALGKFGKDVKPLTDRMREVAGIARRGAQEYDRLSPPEEVKRLPAPDTENE